MNMKMKWIFGVAVLGLSLPVMATQDFVSCEDFAPYVGVDAKWNSMRFKKTAGDNLIQKNYPQGNLFGGVKFNDYFGLELGYESTTRRNKTATAAVGDNFFGDIVDPPEPVNYSKTKTKISGFHLNVVGFYPICEEYCLSLFGSLGLAQLKLKSHLDFSVPTNPRVVGLDFSKQKLVPRATLGIQHMLCENIGVRAMFGWERTSAFKNVKAKNSTLFMSPKDSVSIGLGVFYNF